MVVAKMALLLSLVEFLVSCNTPIISKIFVHLWDILKDELEYFQRVQSVSETNIEWRGNS